MNDKESGASKIRKYSNAPSVIKEKALEKYCNSRYEFRIKDKSYCIATKMHNECCPLYREFIRTLEYIDWSEEQTDAVGDCDFANEYYPDNWINMAYNLLPTEARIESDKELEETENTEK